MDFELRTIPDCPNVPPARALFEQALVNEGFDLAGLTIRDISSPAEATELGFHGSPTFTANGLDLFPSAAEPAVSCRVYPTGGGLAGQPLLEDLRQAIRHAAGTA